MTRSTPPSLSNAVRWSLAAAVSFSLVSAAWPAAAQTAEPVLREQINVQSDLVTLGDLFENAGATGGTPVFRAPDLGTEGVVASKRVAAAARQHGLIWRNPGGIEQVIVRRPSRIVTADAIAGLIKARAAKESGVVDRAAFDIRFSRNPRPFHLDTRVTAPLVVRRFELEDRTGAFRAVIGVDTTLQTVRDRVYQGQAYESVKVAVPARDIPRGATIVEEDMRTIRMAKRRMPAGTASDMGDVVGMAAKRQLSADRQVRRSDLERPKLVRRNTLVTIVYRGPGLMLKAQGRAQADGAVGETVAVLNTQSKRTVQARVDGPGLVSIASAVAVPRTQGQMAADPMVTSSVQRKARAARRGPPTVSRGSHGR
ncbi:MAG: flagellar basal body P-ring formation chaperone FlgA [Methyloligellaceae bacterium]